MLGRLRSHLGNVMFPAWEFNVLKVGIMLHIGGSFDSHLNDNDTTHSFRFVDG